MSAILEAKKKIIECKIAALRAKASTNRGTDEEDGEPAPKKSKQSSSKITTSKTVKTKKEPKVEEEDVEIVQIQGVEDVEYTVEGDETVVVTSVTTDDTEFEIISVRADSPDREQAEDGASKTLAEGHGGEFQEYDEPEPLTAKDLFSVFKATAESEEEEEESGDNQEDVGNTTVGASKGMKSYRKKYKKEWEEVPSFKPWISASVHGATFFYCKFCKKDYRCGKSEVIKHMGSKRHQKLMTTAVTRVERKFTFRGLLCPVFTLFDGKKATNINEAAIKQYANYLKSCGVKGVLINDILGEGPSLTVPERMRLAEVWSTQCDKNGQFLMVQVGGAPFVEVIEMVKHAEVINAGAIVLLPDVHSRPKNHLDIIRYIKLISEVSKKLPILLHYCPEYINFKMDVTQFLLDITGEVDSFVGVIYTTNDLQKAVSALTVNEDKYAVFLGTDEIIIGGVASGFSCIMSNSMNLFAKLVQSICNAMQKGEIKTAQLSQNVLHRAMSRILCHGDMVPALKVAMNIVTPISDVMSRPPLAPIWEGLVKKMATDLQEIGVV